MKYRRRLRAASEAKATPTPMPASAPVDKPLFEATVAEGDKVCDVVVEEAKVVLGETMKVLVATHPAVGSEKIVCSRLRAGALKYSFVGLSQLGFPLESCPQHCQSSAVLFHTASGCA